MTESTDHSESKRGRTNERISGAATRSDAGGTRYVSPNALYRIAAAALVVAGAALAIGEFLHPSPPFADSVASTQWAVAHVLWWIGALAAALGFAGLYLRHRESVGTVGFVGAGFAVVGSVLIACAMFFEAFVASTIATQAPALFETYPAGGGWEGFLAGVLAAGALIGVGLLLFGFALLRAGTVPRWMIALTVLGGVPFAVNFLLPHVVAMVAAAAFGVGLAGLGTALWRTSDSPTATPFAE